MANPYPALITDANSETRVAGQITFTDPANQPGGAQTVTDGTVSVDATSVQFRSGLVTDLGGGMAGVALDPPLEVVQMTGTAIAAGGDYLTMSHASGDTILDYTDPQFPTFIVDGLYALTARSETPDSVPAKNWIVAHFVGDGAVLGQQVLSGPIVAPGANAPSLSTEHVRNLPATTGITYIYIDHDNDTTLDFTGVMIVQRIG